MEGERKRKKTSEFTYGILQKLLSSCKFVYHDLNKPLLLTHVEIDSLDQD